jgi:hypothetical protein
MAFISPALIARIYQALGRNKGCHAILLLRQHHFDQQPTHDKELMPLVVHTADQCLVEHDLVRAEDHFKLGLALYSTCFQDNAIDALRCLSGLCTIYEQQGRTAELTNAISEIEEVTSVVRAAHAVQAA